LPKVQLVSANNHQHCLSARGGKPVRHPQNVLMHAPTKKSPHSSVFKWLVKMAAFCLFTGDRLPVQALNHVC